MVKLPIFAIFAHFEQLASPVGKAWWVSEVKTHFYPTWAVSKLWAQTI